MNCRAMFDIYRYVSFQTKNTDYHYLNPRNSLFVPLIRTVQKGILYCAYFNRKAKFPTYEYRSMIFDSVTMHPAEN